jgi:hypothetical protein
VTVVATGLDERGRRTPAPSSPSPPAPTAPREEPLEPPSFLR